MLPLNGVRVLAVEQYGAGPFGTMFLADQGAEVIKIENPLDGGDMSRAVGPYFFAPGDSQFFHSFNRNKKSITLDLARPEGQAVLHDLVRSADALASNLRGDVPAKLGLVYERLKDSEPEDRVRAPFRLRPQRPARRLAGLRLPHAGGGGLFLVDRRARRAAGALRALDRGPDDGTRARLRAAGGAHRGARDRDGTRHRREPVRHGAPQHAPISRLGI